MAPTVAAIRPIRGAKEPSTWPQDICGRRHFGVTVAVAHPEQVWTPQISELLILDTGHWSMSANGPNRHSNEIRRPSSPTVQLPVSETTTLLATMRKGDQAWAGRRVVAVSCRQSQLEPYVRAFLNAAL